MDPQLVARFEQHRDRAGILLDFDGSLSEIAPTPEEATALAGARDVLAALAGRYRRVAVISGRRAGAVAELIGRPAGVRCFGLYGLEDEDGPTDAAAGALLERIRAVLPEVERAASFVPGSLVEPKGFTVAVHYRGAPDREAARRVLLERLGAIGASEGLRLLEGRRVLELAPAGGPTKGDVVLRVAAQDGLGLVLYAGDDVADREAFAAIDRLRDRGVEGLKVAVRSGESPSELVASADAVVEGPSGLLALLRRLAGLSR